VPRPADALPLDALPLDAYVRVSAVGERGGDESYGSPTVQREAAERWAEYKTERLARVHIDEDESGGTQDRPGLNAAIERALSGQTGGIVAYNISRFSRFTEGGLRDLRRLREKGARLVFVQEDIDTSTWQGRMVYTILLAIHEAALEQLKAGWKVTKARAISEGRQIGPTPPGYRRTTERNGRPKGSLVPDGERGEAITDAYNAVARSRDLREALPILHKAFPTKTFVARKRATAVRYGVELGAPVTVDATWNTTTARRVLASRVYLGEAFYGDGEIETNRDAHPALIDGTTWRRVQKIIGIPEALRRQPKGEYPLSSGALVCATCGGPLIGGRMGASRRGYHCNTNKLRTAETCEHPARVLADPLEACVRALLVAHAQALEDELDEYVTLAQLREGFATGGALGPEDVSDTMADARRALVDAEAQLAKVEALSGSLPEEAFAAAVDAQDRVVSEARAQLEVAQAEASEEETTPPEPTEIAYAGVEQLAEFLERYGLVARVEPAFGDRRPGRVGERVSLVSREGR
jgi:DNA invertase Pin-like site-specific DNA recombinase